MDGRRRGLSMIFKRLVVLVVVSSLVISQALPAPAYAGFTLGYEEEVARNGDIAVEDEAVDQEDEGSETLSAAGSDEAAGNAAGNSADDAAGNAAGEAAGNAADEGAVDDARDSDASAQEGAETLGGGVD